MKTCYIVGAGEGWRDFSPCEDDFVIAADGGFDTLTRHGVGVNLLLGDFDSVSSVPNDIETLKYPREKDYTDMHLAYLEGVKRGFNNFVILGGYGGRFDHTVANLQLLLKIKNDGNSCELVTDNGYITVLHNEKREFSFDNPTDISIFAQGGDALGVTLSGFRYNVENYTMKCDYPIGVSNYSVEKHCFIEVKSGNLLVIVAERK